MALHKLILWLGIITAGVVAGSASPRNLPLNDAHSRAPAHAALVSSVSPASAARAQAVFGRLPLTFIENRGQVDSQVAYYVRGRTTSLYFTSGGVTFALASPTTQLLTQQHDRQLGLPPTAIGKQPSATAGPQRWALKLDFIGADRSVRPTGQARTSTTINYFTGSRASWKTALPSYTAISYPQLWPGIDLTYAGTAGALKYAFIVQPGADPARIQLAYRGATAVRVDRAGQLIITTPLGDMLDQAPDVYQEINGRRISVAASYQLLETTDAQRFRYRFRIGAYDHTKPLILDPTVVVYAGYIGGGGDEIGRSIAVDRAGNLYITGVTTSSETTFPVAVGPDLTGMGIQGLWETFVAKVAADGSRLIYAGYINGSESYAIAVDDAGNAYLAGIAAIGVASSFPAIGGPDLSFNGGTSDAFLAKVSADGTQLLYAGFIGGAGEDQGFGIAVDSTGNAYITGATNSPETSFPIKDGPRLIHAGGKDGFITKIDPTGSTIVYSGYIGGASDDYSLGIAVDISGRAYIAGHTLSTQATFPVVIGPDLTSNNLLDGYDAFVAKIAANGGQLIYAGFIGGVGMDVGYGIALDRLDNAYITGITRSPPSSFPVTVGPKLTLSSDDFDAFVVKVNPNGTGLVYAGYIGGDARDEGLGIAVDGQGSAYVTGVTQSSESTFLVLDGPDLRYHGGNDGFVAKVAPDGTQLVYAGYIGGPRVDLGAGIAVSQNGQAYIIGTTEGGIAVRGGPDVTYNNGNSDAFVMKVGNLTIYLPVTHR